MKTSKTELKRYKFNLLLHKRYFDIGYGFTAIAKYLIALIGISNTIVTQSINSVLIMGAGYVAFCYIFGLLFVKYGWYTAQIEIGNQFNLFVQEMRKNYNKRKV